ncbi:unnamed protein product, partial [Protopolystoma xenopodis]
SNKIFTLLTAILADIYDELTADYQRALEATQSVHEVEEMTGADAPLQPDLPLLPWKPRQISAKLLELGLVSNRAEFGKYPRRLDRQPSRDRKHIRRSRLESDPGNSLSDANQTEIRTSEDSDEFQGSEIIRRPLLRSGSKAKSRVHVKRRRRDNLEAESEIVSSLKSDERVEEDEDDMPLAALSILAESDRISSNR